MRGARTHPRRPFVRNDVVQSERQQLAGKRPKPCDHHEPVLEAVARMQQRADRQVKIANK
jgi:hypothetical protein